MNQKKITLKDLLGFIPESFFDKIAAETNVDFQVKKLNGKVMFNLIMMGLLDSERISLRVMEQIYSSQKFKIISGIWAKEETKHSSIGDRISTISSDYFEELFIKCVETFNSKFKKKEIGKYNIERFDSTMVSLSSKLLSFGMVNGLKNKEGKHTINQLKFTIGFNGLIPHKAKIYTAQTHLGEDLPLYETIMENKYDEKSIAVFDRGLKSRKKFAAIDKEKKLFVTRINQTNNYKIIEIINSKAIETEGLIIKKELKVYLLSGNKTVIKTPLRLIIAKQKETNQSIFFVTNITDLNAEEICEVYKKRWDIEVFFRFLKQELNLKHLVSRTANGIKVMLYMTLITAMLLLIYKEINNVKGYKMAKRKFVSELDNEILKIIIIACNGNPDKLDKIKRFKGFGQ
jgi:hypothetical protein